MTVQDLISKLSEYPSDMPIIFQDSEGYDYHNYTPYIIDYTGSFRSSVSDLDSIYQGKVLYLELE